MFRLFCRSDEILIRTAHSIPGIFLAAKKIQSAVHKYKLGPAVHICQSLGSQLTIKYKISFFDCYFFLHHQQRETTGTYLPGMPYARRMADNWLVMMRQYQQAPVLHSGRPTGAKCKRQAPRNGNYAKTNGSCAKQQR